MLKARPPGEVRQREPTILIQGDAKVGKTTMAVQCPRTFLIDTEDGASLPQYLKCLTVNGGAYLGVDDGGADFDVVLQQVDALTNESHEFQTLVIDSLSHLFNGEIQKEYERLKKSGRDMTSTYGAEKKPAIGKMRSLIHRLAGLNMTKLLIHQEKPNWSGGEINGVTIDGWDRINYVVDLVIHVVRSGQQRLAKVERSRLQQFPEGLSFPWSYDEFAKRLHSQPAKPDIADDNVDAVDGSGDVKNQSDKHHDSNNGPHDDLRTLIRETRTPIEVVDRWLAKAGVDSWDKVPAEIVGKCINHLAAEKKALDKQ